MSAPPEHQLFHPDQADAYVRTMRLGVDHLADALRRVAGPATGQAPEKAARLVADVDLDRPLGDPADALAEMSRIYLDDAIWFHEPTYAAHLNCPVVIPALLAEVFVSGVNSSLDTFDQSVGGTFVERHLVDWTAARIGFGPTAPTGSSPAAAPSRTSRACTSPATARWPAGPPGSSAGCGSSRPSTGTSASRRPPACSASATPRSSRSRPTPAAGWTSAPSARRCRRPSPTGWSRWPSSPPPAPPTSARSTRCAPSPSSATCTTPGCTSTRRTAAGCSPRTGCGTGWPASSAPTR